jgi:hypothetical protein
MLISTLKNTISNRGIGFLFLCLLVAPFFIFGCNNNVVARQGSVKGRVETVMGAALEGAKAVWVGDESCYDYTDELGAYYIEGVSFGLQQFRVERLGYNDTFFECRVYSGSTSEATAVTMGSKSFDYLDINVAQISSSHAIITWKTTDYTYGMVQYGVTDSLGSAVKESELSYSTTHSVKLVNLAPETIYYFRIVSSRENQPSESSNISTFGTISSLEDNYPPTTPAGVEVSLSNNPGEAVVFWQPVYDSDLKGYKIFRGEAKLGTFSQVGESIIPKGQERLVDKSVVPGKKYFYRVIAVDDAGNESGYNGETEGIVIPGNITSEVRWTVANSPYVLKGDIKVTEFGHLRIDDGVKVLVDTLDRVNMGYEPNKIELVVNGALTTEMGPSKITFASAETTPGKGLWQGILVDNSMGGQVSLKNLVVSDAVEGIKIKGSSDVTLNDVRVVNCHKGLVSAGSTNVSLSRLSTERCEVGAEFSHNTNLSLVDSTFMKPAQGVVSENNAGLTVMGCNFVDFTGTGLSSEEASGIVRFSNNLFVSSSALGMKIKALSPLVEYNSFDTPYGIFVTSGGPVIRKNLFMARSSIFGEGRIGIEYSSATEVPVGPNNMADFEIEQAYVGCAPTGDSTWAQVLLMKESNGKPYDYRLRQDFPDSDDPWGMKRDYIVGE